MIWKLLAAPLIGAIIGYCTNWLAVKMLFRPRQAKYIGGHRVPFTPGVIPKGKLRLAATIGNVINTQLLSRESIEQRLLSDEVVGMVRDYVEDYVESLKADESTSVKELAGKVADEMELNLAVNKAQEFLSSHVAERVKAAQLGQMVSDTLMGQLGAVINGSFLGKMMGESMLPAIGGAVTQAVDSYVDQNADSIIRGIVRDETAAVMALPAEKIINGIESAGYDLTEIAVDAYRRAVKAKAGAVIEKLDIGDIARKTIEDMDNAQLEELVLSTMKTELGAIINLGAVIGLVLGLINMVIYLL